MTDPAPKPMPCPNPKCNSTADLWLDANSLPGNAKYPNGGMSVTCSCGYTGPMADSSDEAVRLHNLIARPQQSAEPVAYEISGIDGDREYTRLDYSEELRPGEEITGRLYASPGPSVAAVEKLVEELRDWAQQYEDADNSVQTQIADRLSALIRGSK